MNTEDVELWLEFEEFDQSEPWDADNELFNMQITLRDRTYALNVWSYGFMQEQLALPSSAQDGFIEPPDLLVATCTRAHMERVVKNLIDQNALKGQWLTED